MRRIFDYLRLLRRHPLLSLAAWATVVATRLALCVLPYRMIQRVAPAADDAASDTHGDSARQYRIAQAVRTASWLVPGATCLTQALATQALLHLRGDRPKLCFGIARNERGRLEAHAWLEANGRIVIGGLPDLERYQRFASSTTVT